MSRPVVMIDRWEAMLLGPDRRAFRVGIVAPMTGNLGLMGPTIFHAVSLAAEELNYNRSGGFRRVELVVVDSGQDAHAVVSSIIDLESAGTVDAFLGVHSNENLTAIQRAGRAAPYIYIPHHEGLHGEPGFYCGGDSLVSSESHLKWFNCYRGVSEWAIIGTDYVGPRAARKAQRHEIEFLGGRIQHDELTRPGLTAGQARLLVDRAQASGAQAVIMNVIGRDLVTLLKAARSLGHDRRIIRYSPGRLEENTLLALGGDRSGNLYSSMHSFNSVHSERRRELHQRQIKAVGDDAPVLTSWGEHAYDSLLHLAELDARGELTTSLDRLREVPADDADEPYAHDSRAHLAVARGFMFEVLPQEVQTTQSGRA
ncbi:ABC transporter substrate-binding protein [Pseudarthrobacter sp. NPDC058329]|uniref:ABC transporter substrate-binding protein n=1 Tax=Pseudarthrobacter sp. NPDC058329 TaxID=3346448 RepID=UPI0036DDF7CF